MPDEVRKEIKKSIREHGELLRELLRTAAGHAKQYLVVTNAGAAVALMAFMGSSESVRSSPIAWASLCLFVLGVIATGAMNALDHYVCQHDFLTWLSDSDQFFANSIEIEELYARLNGRNKKLGKLPVIAGYVAFGCLIFGGTLSAGHFLTSSIHPKLGLYDVLGTAPWCVLDETTKALYCDYYSERHCYRSGPVSADDTAEFCVRRTE